MINTSTVYTGKLNKLNIDKHNKDLVFIDDLKSIFFNGNFYGYERIDKYNLSSYITNGTYYKICHLNNTEISDLPTELNITDKLSVIVLNVFINDSYIYQLLTIYNNDGSNSYLRNSLIGGSFSNWVVQNNSNNNNNETEIIWNNNSNMNNYITQGVYNIYGERTNQLDNLPFNQAFNGASFSAKLTVIASTLRPNNNEICVTQFLELSNRMAGEGNIYIRTYNQNNNGLNGWSDWKKIQGLVESYINTDSVGITATGNYTTGINAMIDNGMYSGIYTDDLTLQAPTFVETFIIVTINDYAISAAINTPRRVSQLKYAINTITGDVSVKKRIGTENNGLQWSNWEELGGGSNNIVDITTQLLQTKNLFSLINNVIVEGKTYVARIPNVEFSTDSIWIDTNQQINKDVDINANSLDGNAELSIKLHKLSSDDYFTLFVDIVLDSGICLNYMFQGYDLDSPVRISNTSPVISEETVTTKLLYPNIFYKWGVIDYLKITLHNGDGDKTILEEFMFQFSSGESATTLELSSGIKWLSTPNIQPNKTYQVSIVNNLGVIGEFGNE